MKKRNAGAIALSVLFSACLLAGCMGTVSSNSLSSASDQTAINRQYIADVHTTVRSIQAPASQLALCLQKGDEASLDAKLSAIDKLVEDLSNADAPSDLTKVKEGYVQACTTLASALRDYAEYRTGETPSAARLAEIQQAYDKGMQMLKDTDDLAASL